MEQLSPKKTGTAPRLACYIRLTQQEHDRLQKEARVSGKGMQVLLKNAYFKGAPLVLLMQNDDRDKLMTQLHRIGNNVNQIAKHLNTGFAYGFQQELESIRSQLSLIMTWITARYRAHKIDPK